MRRIVLTPLIVGALGLAFAGCSEPGYYSESAPYNEGLGPPPPPPAEQPAPPVAEQPAPPPASAPGNEAELSLFYNDLSPYGRWVVVAQYGRVFVPAGIGADWRPYTVGRWEYTDYGWTWVSDEPFGWATCHYGGWVSVPQYGWAWVPGTQWGPAWVAWREGEGYVGWAPLPPHHGVDINVSIGNEIPPTHYTFVDERYVTAPQIRQHVVNVQQNTTIIRKTTNITNIKVVNNKVVNNSLNVQRVERVTGKRIQPKVVRTAERPTKAAVHGDAVEIYRPKPRPAAGERAPQPTPKTAPPAAKAPPAVRTPSAAEQQRLEQQRLEQQRLERERAAKTAGPAVVNNKAYEAERARLAQEHVQQRQQLEQRQLKERQNRPANISAAEQQRQHEAQAKALEERQHKELQNLQKEHNQPAK